MNISEHRKAIDNLDEQIVRLLNERTRHVLEIGTLKLKQGEEIYAPHRELGAAEGGQAEQRADQRGIVAGDLPRNNVERAIAGEVLDDRLLRAGSDVHASGGDPAVRRQFALLAA